MIESEIRIVDKKENIKYVHFKIVVKRSSGGQLTRLLGFMQDITEKRALEKELADQALRQQKLITEISIEAQEKERNWLGRELHDNVNQILASIKMFIGMSDSYPDKREELMKRSVDNVDNAIEEIRKLSRTLVDPSIGDLGLIYGLQELANQINVDTQLRVELLSEMDNEKKLDKGVELMIYRIAQEQLNNIQKHAKASHAVITIKTNQSDLYFSVVDDGVGFNVKKQGNGIGLKNIRSRVDSYSGNMEIISAPGKGCSLNISIPFK
jgi:two-component system sensor histidine kinase UhpB